jgi:hypothetical protein
MKSSVKETYQCVCPKCGIEYKRKLFLFDPPKDGIVKRPCAKCIRLSNKTDIDVSCYGGREKRVIYTKTIEKSW